MVGQQGQLVQLVGVGEEGRHAVGAALSRGDDHVDATVGEQGLGLGLDGLNY